MVTSGENAGTVRSEEDIKPWGGYTGFDGLCERVEILSPLRVSSILAATYGVFPREYSNTNFNIL